MEKVDERIPDVTNQTDKEPGQPRSATQLWLQLCTVVEPVCLLRERKKDWGRNGEGGERQGKKRSK